MRTLAVSSLLVLALTGCKPFWNPTYMPSGYAHHHKEYKSPPGPKAAPIGYEYSAKKNTAMQQQWRAAVSDLVLRAQAHDLLGAGPVFIHTDLNPGAFQSAYDFALREELRAAGVMLAESADQGSQIFYSAYDPQDKGPAEYLTGYNDEAHHPHKDGDFLPPSKTMKLILASTENGIVGEKIISMQDVPLYGFKPAGYAPQHERPRELEPKQCSAHAQSEKDAGYND